MPNEITYSMDTAGVNWDRLKSALSRDEFDNGRTPVQLRASFENSRHRVFAWRDGEVIGTVRALSDGVCNAYVVDVWTSTALRRRGIATSMLQRLLTQLNGQHVALMADDAEELYRKLGFVKQPGGRFAGGRAVAGGGVCLRRRRSFRANRQNRSTASFFCGMTRIFRGFLRVASSSPGQSNGTHFEKMIRPVPGIGHAPHRASPALGSVFTV